MFGFPAMPAMRPMPGMPPFPEMPAMPPMPTMPDIPRQPDLVEHPDRYTVEASAPDFSPEDVHVELSEDNTLMVSGSKVVNTGKQSSASSFSRSFALPGNIRADGIRAHLDLGVLTVDIPKAMPGVLSQRRNIVVERGHGQAAADNAPAGAAETR